MSQEDGQKSDRAKDFARQADAAPASFMSEFWMFLKTNKKWWLTPIIISLLLVGVLILLSGTAFAPFIYPLF